MKNHRWELLTAGDMMKADIISVQKHATCQDIAKVLVDCAISGVAVRDLDGEIVGVISWRDVMESDLEAATPFRTAHEYFASGGLFSPLGPTRRATPLAPAESIMNRELLSIESTAGLREVAARMSEYRVHRLFVTDKDEAIVGILSTFDVIDALCA